MKKILIHGSGHKADSYNETIKYMNSDDVFASRFIFDFEW